MPVVKELTGRTKYDLGFKTDSGFKESCSSSTGFKGFADVPKKKDKSNSVVIIEARPVSIQKLKVAAYCRVSTLFDSQDGSIVHQRKHYEEFIAANSQWECAGVYVETGVTGTKAEIRPELQRMIQDCKAGRIQLILTKSISRFSRNTTDCLSMVRELTALGVDIWFEKEGIHTGTMESEFMLSILACLAEDESRSISNNMKWGLRKRFQAGTYKAKEAPYGYRRVGLDFVIMPEEAEIVRFIFSSYLSGSGTRRIANELNRRNISAMRGGQWSTETIRVILNNPAYTGDLIYQKSFMDENYHQRMNKGELDQYVNADHHEAIVSKEEFAAAQELKVHNCNNKCTPRPDHVFTSMLKCQTCGATLRRYTKNGRVTYRCNHCGGAELEENIRSAFITCLNKLAFSQQQHPQFRILDVYEKSLQFADHSARIAEIDGILEKHNVELRKINSMALFHHFNQEQMDRRDALLAEDDILRREKMELVAEGEQGSPVDELRDFISGWKSTNNPDEFPENVFRTLITQATMTPGKQITFRFACGLELTERLTDHTANTLANVSAVEIKTLKGARKCTEQPLMATA